MPQNLKKFIPKIKRKLIKFSFFEKFNSTVRVRIRDFFAFRSDFHRFKKLTLISEPRFSLNWSDREPCLFDKTDFTPFDPQYIYHPAWAARILVKTRPESHIDISSILWFSTTISAFIPVKFYEYRKPKIKLEGLTINSIDLHRLKFKTNSIKSISCMHVIEHLGLGRYGDSFDPDSDLKAIAELKRVLAPGGNLLFVIPLGKPKILFNSHRVYSYAQVISYFSELKLKEFALIAEGPEEPLGLQYITPKNNPGENISGCGCFWFQGI